MKKELFEIMESFSSLGIGSMKYQCKEFELELYSESLQEKAPSQKTPEENEKNEVKSAVDSVCTDSFISKELYKVLSPLVGVFYSRPSPESGSFVKVGDRVEEGDVLCIMEAMKMFNEIKAPVSGKIVNVHFQDEDLVGFDETIFEIEVL